MVGVDMGLENHADFVAILLDEVQYSVSRLGADVLGCAVVVEDGIDDYCR